MINPKFHKAIFLDRDGTINQEHGYVHTKEEWEWIPGSIDAIRRFKDAGYLLVVITNQAGIARGYYKEDAVHLLHQFINEELQKYGTHIDAFYYCPHHPDITGNCECRKPMPGMILQAIDDLNISPKDSWMIGDKANDIEAGEAAGLRCLLVQTGYGDKESHLVHPGIPHFKNLQEASMWILKKQPSWQGAS